MAFKRIKRFLLYQIVPLAFGLLLLVSVVHSVVQIFTRGLETSNFFSIPLNLSVGALLVASGHLRSVRVFGCLLFTTYCVYLAINLFYGQQSCSCLGAGTSATLMFVVDLIGATSLGFLSIRFGSSKLANSCEGIKYSTIGMLVGMLLFGSVSLGVLLQSRQPLQIIDTKLDSKHSVPNDPQALELVIANTSNKPFRIYGVEKSCQLVSVSEFPIDLKPGQKKTVQIRLRKAGLGKSIQYLDRGIIRMFVSKDSSSLSLLSAYWFFKKA